ncbi:MAG: tRNA 2-thiouridine(34) synthase MnmA, partial [Nitrospirota bacterium]
MRRKVAVAMSGGVDSSVAAALLKEEKYEVTGLTMRLWGNAGDDMDAADSAVSSASKTCRILGIPHRVIDIREQFKKKVIDYFLSEYLRGLTPNPCVVCNEKIKFGLLMDMMALDGAERLATGHYADIAFDAGTGRHNLLCAADRKKDQSYFLYRLNQRQLGLTLFPLGGMIKAEVIGKARAMGLPAAEREESQEICFVPGDDYRALIESERPGAVQGGDFIDMDGRVIGRHKGVAFYTIGQRRGLGYSSQLGRRYVIARDPFNNT